MPVIYFMRHKLHGKGADRWLGSLWKTYWHRKWRVYRPTNAIIELWKAQKLVHSSPLRHESSLGITASHRSTRSSWRLGTRAVMQWRMCSPRPCPLCGWPANTYRRIRSLVHVSCIFKGLPDQTHGQVAFTSYIHEQNKCIFESGKERP